MLAVGWVGCHDAPAPPVAKPEADATSVVNTSAEDTSAVALIQRVRAAHGSHRLDSATVTFTFRGTPFEVEREGGRFAYTRVWTDSTGSGRDVLSNDGVVRFVDGEPVPLDVEAARIAEEKIGSVVYFALLPYALADPAVQPRLVGQDTLSGRGYELLEVTFRKEGGGRDYQDRFLYWVHPEQATIDYLAYSYEVNGGGARFRQAVNPRTVGGVRFADYVNFAAEPATPLERLWALWATDSLELRSRIVLEDVRVFATEPIEQ